MAVLTDESRTITWAEAMQLFSGAGESVSITKADLRAAVDALDSFMNTNAGAINTAIPQPARAALSTPQKARLLMLVIQRRYLDGS